MEIKHDKRVVKINIQKYGMKIMHNKRILQTIILLISMMNNEHKHHPNLV